MNFSQQFSSLLIILSQNVFIQIIKIFIQSLFLLFLQQFWVPILSSQTFYLIRRIIMEIKKLSSNIKQNIDPSEKTIPIQAEKPNSTDISQSTIRKCLNEQASIKEVKKNKEQKLKETKIDDVSDVNEQKQKEYSNSPKNQKLKKQKEVNLTCKTTHRGLTDKIKQNQINIQTQTKQFHNHSVNFQEEVHLSKKQKQRLKVYFKHICQGLYNCPRNFTFDDVRNIYNTINLTQWMIFCKKMGIIEKFKKFDDMAIDANGIKLLSHIYKKYEDIDRRMNLSNFFVAFKEIIYVLVQNLTNSETDKNQNGEQLKKQKIKQVLEQLCLRSKKKFIAKLRSMGVMCSQQVYVFNESSRTPKVSRSVKSGKKQEINRTHNERSSVNTCLESSNALTIEKEKKEKHRTNQHIIPKIKLYKERKQSKLMHNLLISNINKILPSEETTASLKKFLAHEDKYLKEYFVKEEKIKRGMMLRLEKGRKLGNKKKINI